MGSANPAGFCFHFDSHVDDRSTNLPPIYINCTLLSCGEALANPILLITQHDGETDAALGSLPAVPAHPCQQHAVPPALHHYELVYGVTTGQRAAALQHNLRPQATSQLQPLKFVSRLHTALRTPSTDYFIG